MADKRKALTGLAEQLIGIADGGATTGSGTPANLTEAVSGQVQELLGISEADAAQAVQTDPGSVESFTTTKGEVTGTTEELAGNLIRDSESAVERVADLNSRDAGEPTEDGEFSSKWDWRREAAERAGG
jgi:hypothetical protein